VFAVRCYMSRPSNTVRQLLGESCSRYLFFWRNRDDRFSQEQDHAARRCRFSIAVPGVSATLGNQNRSRLVRKRDGKTKPASALRAPVFVGGWSRKRNAQAARRYDASSRQ
jgi:hypothetical protein